MFYVNVLTPDRVPEFFIPPKFTPQRKAGAAEQRAGVGPALRGGQVAALDGRPGGDGTDWDPRSRAALSLPHFPRADTPYGFCRLLESPHTRRKESLFHGRPEDQGAARGAPAACPRLPAPGGRPAEPGGQRLLLLRTPAWRTLLLGSSRRKGRPPPASSSSSSTRSSSSSRREGGSLPSSPEQSPRVRGAPFTPGVAPPGIGRTKESTAALGPRGVLRLRAEFCSERQRVWLRLLSVEGLYEPFADCRGISCCLSLQLEPGKSQKQRSAVIRKDRNPIFNQDFYFFGITGDQLHSKLFKIKVINKASRMKRGSVLGVCQLSLASILPL